MLYAELFTEFIGTYVLCSIILSNPKPILLDYLLQI